MNRPEPFVREDTAFTMDLDPDEAIRHGARVPIDVDFRGEAMAALSEDAASAMGLWLVEAAAYVNHVKGEPAV